MLIRKFKSNNPFLFVPLIFVAALLWIDGFLLFGQSGLDYENAAPLYKPIAVFFNNYRFWNVLLGFLFLLLQTFLFNKVITENNLVDRNSFLPALIYLVFMSNSFYLLGLHPALFANFFLILALSKIFEVYSEQNVYFEIFNVGLLVSLASLFYVPAFWFILLVFAALLIYYLLNPRGIMAVIIGFATPYLFMVLYFFWFDALQDKINEMWEFHRPLAVLTVSFSPYARLSAIVMGLITLVAFFKVYLGPSYDKPVRIRNRFRVLLIFFIVSLISGLFAYEYLTIHYAMIMLPLSAIVAVFFQQNKKVFWNEFFFSLLIIVIVIGKLARLD